MTDPQDARRVEIKDGDQTVATAEVSRQPGGTTRASLHAAAGHIAPGRRADLVDAVVDLPEVQECARLEATIPLGDTETLDRLRERTEDTTSRAAGSTALVDGSVPGDKNRRNEDDAGPPGRGPASDPPPDGETPGA
ncbi:MAG TPA: hypothetical protein VE464_19050 [Streptosporangiaceae bacterium]|jgi:hypothetical protein|nr:hypothetical protein [Streptosporangiaceae bacterium]